MKKQVTIESSFCDLCGKENFVYECRGCNKEVCSDCKRNGQAVEYPKSVWFDGSGGTYCHTCDLVLTKGGTNKLHQAYQAVARLREEAKAWRVDFETRANAAEATVKALLP